MKKKIIVCLAALTCLAAGGGTALAYISDSAYVSNQLAFAGGKRAECQADRAILESAEGTSYSAGSGDPQGSSGDQYLRTGYE